MSTCCVLNGESKIMYQPYSNIASYENASSLPEQQQQQRQESNLGYERLQEESPHLKAAAEASQQHINSKVRSCSL
jgi:hypothetical protein